MESTDTTYWLQRFREGDPAAEQTLLELLYNELRRRAKAEMARERVGHTLQPTALVNEAYMRLIDQRSKNWHNRAHFLAVASQVMRRILIDHARGRLANKRGGNQVRMELTDGSATFTPEPEQILSLEFALNRLAELDPRQAKIVELRFFGGLTEDEVSEILQINARTVKREWSMAKSWLYAQLNTKEE